MEAITFVGLDLHKRMTSVALAESGRGGEVRFLGEIPSTPEALHRVVERLKGRHRQLSFCPENKRSIGERGLRRTWSEQDLVAERVEPPQRARRDPPLRVAGWPQTLRSIAHRATGRANLGKRDRPARSLPAGSCAGIPSCTCRDRGGTRGNRAADLDLVQVIQPARPSQTSADGRLAQERFKNAGDIRAVIDKRVPSRAAPTLVAELAPEVGSVRPTLHRQLRQTGADAPRELRDDARGRPSTRRGNARVHTGASRRGRAGWCNGRNGGALGSKGINQASRFQFWRSFRV